MAVYTTSNQPSLVVVLQPAHSPRSFPIPPLVGFLQNTVQKWFAQPCFFNFYSTGLTGSGVVNIVPLNGNKASEP